MKHKLRFIGTVCIVFTLCSTALGDEPLHIGSQRELFLDAYLIDTVTGVTRELHQPERKGPVMRFDRPWEGGGTGYVTVFEDRLPDGAPYYRMYYHAQPILGQYGDTAWSKADWNAICGPEVTCYAESRDGIHWTRPELNIFQGEFTSRYGKKFTLSFPNNVVWLGQGTQVHSNHNFSPFKDTNPACKSEARYKAIARWLNSPDPSPPQPDKTGYRWPPGAGLVAFQSPDGIHWQLMQQERIIKKTETDSLNVAFWDSQRGCYVCYNRVKPKGWRSIAMLTSKDFLNWSDPPEFLDFGRTPQEHLYTCCILPYFRAPHIYVGLINRLVTGRVWIPQHPEHEVADAVLISSRDGVHFDRSFMEGWIRPGLDPQRQSWIHGNTSPAWGILATAPGELSVYWVDHFGQPGVIPQLQRGTLRTDGFVSMHAKYAGGQFTTKPLVFSGRKLTMNVSTSAVGSVQVEAQDAAGQPLRGFTAADCSPIYGDAIDQPVVWKTGDDRNRSRILKNWYCAVGGHGL